MFVDYLKEYGIVNDMYYNSLKHFLDMELKEFLIETKFANESKINFLWGEYIRNGNNKRP